MDIDALKHAHAVAEAKSLALQDALAEAHNHTDNLMRLWKDADEERMKVAQMLIDAMRESE